LSERKGFRGPGFRSAKLTECLALPERQSVSAIVLTKPDPTMWSIKKEVLAEARTTQSKHLDTSNTINLFQTPLFPPNPECSVSDIKRSAPTYSLWLEVPGGYSIFNPSGLVTRDT
jgi:hypothetical protein